MNDTVRHWLCRAGDGVDALIHIITLGRKRTFIGLDIFFLTSPYRKAQHVRRTHQKTH